MEITPTDDSLARSLVSAGRHVTVTECGLMQPLQYLFIVLSQVSGLVSDPAESKHEKAIQMDVWLCFSLQITEAVIYRFVTTKMFLRRVKLTGVTASVLKTRTKHKMFKGTLFSRIINRITFFKFFMCLDSEINLALLNTFCCCFCSKKTING